VTSEGELAHFEEKKLFSVCIVGQVPTNLREAKSCAVGLSYVTAAGKGKNNVFAEIRMIAYGS
jgi:hypothetical protein